MVILYSSDGKPNCWCVCVSVISFMCRMYKYDYVTSSPVHRAVYNAIIKSTVIIDITVFHCMCVCNRSLLTKLNVFIIYRVSLALNNIDFKD